MSTINASPEKPSSLVRFGWFLLAVITLWGAYDSFHTTLVKWNHISWYWSTLRAIGILSTLYLAMIWFKHAIVPKPKSTLVLASEKEE